MNFISNKLMYKVLVIGVMALALVFIRVEMEGWATTGPKQTSDSYLSSQPLEESKGDSVSYRQGEPGEDGQSKPGTPSAQDCTVEDPCLPEGFPEGRGISHPVETITILKPADQSALPDTTKTVKSLGSKKLGMALILLGALAEGKS
jgi:hypothetical protein